jgi:hypothetical protein
VERSIYNALVCLHRDQLTRDSPQTEAAAVEDQLAVPSSHHSSNTQLMDGLIYFEIFRFLDLLKPMFLSPRHLTSHHSKGWISMLLSSSSAAPSPSVVDIDCHQCAMSLSGIGVNLDNEFDGIRRDLLDLLDPKIDYQIKLEHLKRMRFTHKSLS